MLCWKYHIDQLLPELSTAYYAYFHSIMNYGITFWGNSPYSINIFRLQKKGN